MSTKLVLRNPYLQDRFDVVHLDTSDRRMLASIGRWDLTNIRLGVSAVRQLIRLVRPGRGLVYLPLSQNLGGLFRDALFVRLAKLHGWKVAAHLRGSELHDVYEHAGGAFRLLIRSTLSSLDSLAVMGESVRSTLDGLVAPERIAVVPNGTPDPEPNGRSRDDSTVLFLSNLLRRKGVCESVEAALMVLDRHPSARFVFAGEWEDADLERQLREAAERADDRIRFVGPVTEHEKRRLLLSASILLFPPVLPEGHPRVVLEALAAGLPLVTTNRGTIAETVVPGEAAFVLDEPVPAALAERLLQLLEDDRLRTAMSANGRARFLAHYTQEAADRRLADWLTAVAP